MSSDKKEQDKTKEKPEENKEFNDTLRRMLNTPPKPKSGHKKPAK